MNNIPFSFFADDFKKKKQQYQKISKETYDLYTQNISEEFAGFMMEEGLCVYEKGLFTTVDPIIYNVILKDYGIYSPACVALVKSAFGDIFYFDGTDCRILYTSFHENYAFASGDAVKYFFVMQLSDIDFQNNNFRKKLFRQALKKYGQLSETESYGFVPALPLGGSESIDTIQKVQTLDYLGILSQSKNL